MEGESKQIRAPGYRPLARGRRTASTVLLLGLLTLVCAVWTSWSRLDEVWWIHRLEVDDDEGKAIALSELMKINSIRVAPHIARYALDGSRFGVLQSARQILGIEREPGLVTWAVDPLRPAEDHLRDILCEGPPRLKIQALAVLIRVRASESVGLQWKTLQKLKRFKVNAEWRRVLVEMESRFHPGRLLEEIWENPRGAGNRHCWSIRAAGILRLKDAIPRLGELSACGDFDISLAAEQALENFRCPEGDEALVRCLLGWRYPAFVRAASALLERDRDLLDRTLSGVVAPREWRYWQGIFLARCGNPAAVPLLCSLNRTAILDRATYEQIIRLAARAQKDHTREPPICLQAHPGKGKEDLADLHELPIKNGIYNERQVSALVEMLKNRSAQARRGAVFDLLRLGPGARGAVPALIQSLQDPDSRVRAYSADALARIGLDADSALPAILELLKDRSSMSRCYQPVAAHVARALRCYGRKARRALPALLEALEDREYSIRSEAALSISWIAPEVASGNPGLLKVLVEILDHGDGDNRIEASLALGKLGLTVDDARRALHSGFGRVSFSAQSISEFAEFPGNGGS